MGPAAGPLLASSAELHGTAWLGVAGVVVGLILVVVALVRARRRLAVTVTVAASAVLLIVVVALFGGSLVVIPAVLVGQMVVGVVVGLFVGRDRWPYLAAAAGCLLLALYGAVVLFPSGEEWSGDLFALGAVPFVAAFMWLPLAIGAWITAPDLDLDPEADRSVPRGGAAG